MMDAQPPAPVVLVVGTSHVARESERRIRAAADAFAPTIIAVELDRQRLKALHERTDAPEGKRTAPPLSLMRQVGATGYLFLLVAGWLQRKVGRVLQVEPGLDMLAAVGLARERKLPLALVDQEIAGTLRRVSACFTAREKWRLVGDILTSPFSRRQRALAKRVRLDNVPSDAIVRELLGELRSRYPGLYRALVTERNAHMCARVDALARSHAGARILLVVGAAHKEDIEVRLRAAGRVTLA